VLGVELRNDLWFTDHHGLDVFPPEHIHAEEPLSFPLDCQLAGLLLQVSVGWRGGREDPEAERWSEGFRLCELFKDFGPLNCAAIVRLFPFALHAVELCTFATGSTVDVYALLSLAAATMLVCKGILEYTLE